VESICLFFGCSDAFCLPFFRKLFERIIHMKLPAKKMKVFFKRYLELEEQHGTAASVEHVKKSAQSYVEQYSG
jgi:rRNA biogenesis protein RRP5